MEQIGRFNNRSKGSMKTKTAANVTMKARRAKLYSYPNLIYAKAWISLEVTSRIRAKLVASQRPLYAFRLCSFV
jgi:hypothetical protein